MKKLVQGSDRRKVARPQPPMRDRRTKRNRTRSANKAVAFREQQ